MRELLILILIGGVAYFAYDDYYKQRPALKEARGELQQLRENPVRLGGTPVPQVWVPATPSRPAWFQKRLDEGAALEMSHQHTRQNEQATPRP